MKFNDVKDEYIGKQVFFMYDNRIVNGFIDGWETNGFTIRGQLKRGLSNDTNFFESLDDLISHLISNMIKGV